MQLAWFAVASDDVSGLLLSGISSGCYARCVPLRRAAMASVARASAPSPSAAAWLQAFRPL